MEKETTGGCKRCLLFEMAGKDDVIAQVEKTRQLMSDDERSSDEEYKKRLALCKECDKLIDATCLKCGCYVEIRALSKRAHCPGKKW
ncbi:hypothetical protein D6855_05900 [Butyrivibrio sp. CB08]|uniref:DUF6171 family protein n=1 Tax=Butyrivibrio sp. CB08 TaxID=2364879 RepID=UPI000EA8BEBB|nr:DUF6171 family protein [Butyrivibrio sp. CB08]RKM61425.1 hypothetical protein D6855_05900 [Butyrivibrio sp. CB08]